MAATVKQLQRESHYLASATAKKTAGRPEEDYWRQKALSLQAHNLRLQDQLANTRHKVRKIDDLEGKINLVLGHNTRLNKENQVLKDEINRQNTQSKYSGTMSSLQVQRLMKEHEIEVGKLLDEIADLTTACQRIEQAKDRQITTLRLQLQKVQSRKDSKSLENMQYYQSQIRKLKELLSHRSNQITTVKHQSNLELERCQEEIMYLTNQLQHQQAIAALNLKELKDSNQLAVQRLKNAHSNSMTLTKQTFQAQIQKLKKNLADKLLQHEKMRELMNASGSKGKQQHEALQNRIQYAQLQLLQKQQNHQKALQSQETQLKLQFEREKLKLIQIHQDKIKSAQVLADGFRKMLDSVSDQVAKKDKEIAQIKQMHEAAQEQKDNRIKILSAKIDQNLQLHLGQMECLKIKLQQLRQADLTVLLRTLKQQVERLQQEVLSRDNLISQKNQKINRQISIRVTMRKNYEKIFQSLKGKYRDLKVKFNSMLGQARAQMNTMVTRLQLNSATLLNDAQSKAKSVQALQLQIKKIQQLCQSKDQIINDLEKRLEEQLGQIQQEQSKNYQLSETMKQKIEDLRSETSEQIQNIKELFSRKQQSLQSQKHELQNQISQDRAYYDNLRIKVQTLQKTVIDKQHEIKQTRKAMKQQEADFNARCGFLQSMQIDSSANTEEQKNQMKLVMSKNQVNLKIYYDTKVKKLEKDIQDLKGLLQARADQSLRLNRKIKDLEAKLEASGQSIEQHSQLSKKIISMGNYQSSLLNTIEILRNFRKGELQQ